MLRRIGMRPFTRRIFVDIAEAALFIYMTAHFA
jgi:hypothetical protein